MEYTIHKLARLAGVSVRTLHFYDQQGLLSPMRVADNGYRIYGRDELLRLQQILFFRELKFPLGTIKSILESPDFNPAEALEEQRRLVTLERDRLDDVLATIAKAIAATNEKTNMNDNEMYGGLSRDDMEKYAEEAKERWGSTKAYKQSQERMAKLGKEEQAKLHADSERAVQELADHMAVGFDGDTVQRLIDEQFQGINEMFYDCSIEMFRNLAEMTVGDDRYASYYRRFHPDLPEFRLKAVRFYCDQHDAK